MNRTSNDLPGRTGTVAVVGALAFALLSTVLFTFSPSLNPFDLLAGRFLEVAVPDVRGLTQQKALVQLTRDRLAGEVEFAYDAEVPVGSVARQEPAPSETVKRGGIVVLTVSRGPAFVPVPDIIGAKRGDAVTQLKSLDLKVVEVEQLSEEIDADRVISVVPSVGTIVQSGQKVTLTVSTGPEIRAVPAVPGMTLNGAAFLLGRAGLAIGTVTYQDSLDVRSGAVIATDPAVGVELERDAPVSLVVSSGKPAGPVPSVLGRAQADAVKTLTAAGFVVGEVSELVPFGDPGTGTVSSQVPASGTVLRPGEVVTITVKRALPPPTTVPLTTVPPTTQPPTTTTTTTTIPVAPVETIPGGP